MEPRRQSETSWSLTLIKTSTHSVCRSVCRGIFDQRLCSCLRTHSVCSGVNILAASPMSRTGSWVRNTEITLGTIVPPTVLTGHLPCKRSRKLGATPWYLSAYSITSYSDICVLLLPMVRDCEYCRASSSVKVYNGVALALAPRETFRSSNVSWKKYLVRKW